MKLTQPQPTTRNLDVDDWLNFHGCDAPTVRSTLSCITIEKSDHVSDDELPYPLKLSAQEVWFLTSQALIDALPNVSGEIAFIRDYCERVFDAPSAKLPRTIDRGTDQAPFVSMCYQGTPADALCIAHEFGHALQYHLAGERFVPPVLRELAAFIAEKLLLDFTQKNWPELYALLYAAWQNDSKTYFGYDAKQLRDALSTSSAPYTYRMNYPLARHLADEIFKAFPRTYITEAFQGTLALAALLSTVQDRNGTANMNNYLPAIPDAETDRPAINAYRSLGMMVLLDIDYWQGEPEKSIEEYYAARLAHMQSQTVLVVIGKERKPIGYANWEVCQKNIIRLKRQAAPFGDYLELQERLQARFPENTKVLSHHSRSAREEQVAW